MRHNSSTPFFKLSFGCLPFNHFRVLLQKLKKCFVHISEQLNFWLRYEVEKCRFVIDDLENLEKLQYNFPQSAPFEDKTDDWIIPAKKIKTTKNKFPSGGVGDQLLYALHSIRHMCLARFFHLIYIANQVGSGSWGGMTLSGTKKFVEMGYNQKYIFGKLYRIIDDILSVSFYVDAD